MVFWCRKRQSIETSQAKGRRGSVGSRRKSIKEKLSGFKTETHKVSVKKVREG